MADGERIRDIPSIRKLEELKRSYQRFEKVFPVLRPLLHRLGVDVEDPETAFEDLDIDELAEEVEELASTPDAFNEHFVERGWVMHEYMSLDAAQEAVQLADDGNPDGGESVLVEYYDGDMVQFQLNRMKVIEGFQPRWPLAREALKDYEQGRYHACVPVVLALTDGLVQHVFVDVEGEGQNFSAEDASLEAWDSIAAHSKGLEDLRDELLIGRYKTRTEDIDLPYRHGIMHGMDLGYDNQIVAAKAWNTLFAVGEWARKAEDGELDEPEDEDSPGLLETIQQAYETHQETERIREAGEDWDPRELAVGQDIVPSGGPDDYEDGTPEHALVELLQYWSDKNYGHMAERLLDRNGDPNDPGDLRDQFEGTTLHGFELRDIEDASPVMTDITVEVDREMFGQRETGAIEMRMTKVDNQGNPAILGEGTWTTYTDVNLLAPMD